MNDFEYHKSTVSRRPNKKAFDGTNERKRGKEAAPPSTISIQLRTESQQGRGSKIEKGFVYKMVNIIFILHEKA